MGTVGHEAARRVVDEPAHGRRTLHTLSFPGALLRAVVVAVVAVFAGCLVYVVLPVPSAAAPGLVVAVPAAAVAPPVAGLVGGLLDDTDLVAAPEGVQTAPPDPSVNGLIGWPVSDHTPSTGFGYRSDPFTHTQRWHDGVDLGQPCGDQVHASLAGTVAYAGWAGGYGNRIIVRHADRAGHTFATTYNHLSWIGFGVGQEVDAGQVIAKVGSTGRSTACHLHFEVVLDGAYVDPMRFLTGDQSKAGLSRRVGSYMPSGLPSPTSASASRSATATHKATTTSPRPTSATPTPSPSDTSPTSPSPSPSTASPSPSTESPAPSPTSTTSEAEGPAAGTPVNTGTPDGTPVGPSGQRSGAEPSVPTASQTASEGVA